MNLPQEIAGAIRGLDFDLLKVFAEWRRTTLLEALAKPQDERETARLRGEIAAMKDLIGLRKDVEETLSNGK